MHALKPDWPAFLDDFQHHWPTDDDHTYVDFVREGAFGNGAARIGNARWRRLTEEGTRRAKSVFHFDVQGSIAKSTHAGIPWLRYIRQQTSERVHFWPFDGWDIPVGRSATAEVYPRYGTAPTAMAAQVIHMTPTALPLGCAARIKTAAWCGVPEARPDAPERAIAQVEGWILGVM